MQNKIEQSLLDLLNSMALPAEYANYIPLYFEPIVEKIQSTVSQSQQTPIIAINGSQGSGKSTAALVLQYLLEKFYKHRVAILSIDDFYHTRAVRKQLSQEIHPLMMTRGVPGTHDVELARHTINMLRTTPKGQTIAIPRFDKGTDDRKPRSQWDTLDEPPSVIIFEGWCVGAPPLNEQSLIDPINPLEVNEDPSGNWRKSVNYFLSQSYQELFAQADWLLMLKAPSFDVVYEWRLLQEQKLVQAILESQPNAAEQATNKTLDEQQLQRFIQHYQRITEHCLESLPNIADAVIELDKQHRMISLQLQGVK